MRKISLLFALLFALPGFVFSQTLEPTEDEALVNVKMTNFDGKPLQGELIIFENDSTLKTYQGVTDADGKLSLLLPEGATYLIKIDALTEETEYNKLLIPAGPGMYNSSIEILYEPPKVYTLDDINFDSGKSVIKKSSYPILNELVELLERKPNIEIEVAGHTDNVGDSISNQKLSEQRAKSVRNYLINKGIAASRITYVGYGESKPVATNDTEEGKAENRRTEIRITKE